MCPFGDLTNPTTEPEQDPSAGSGDASTEQTCLMMEGDEEAYETPSSQSDMIGITAEQVADRLTLLGTGTPAERAFITGQQQAHFLAQTAVNTLPYEGHDPTGWVPPYTWTPTGQAYQVLAIYTHPRFANGYHSRE